MGAAGRKSEEQGHRWDLGRLSLSLGGQLIFWDGLRIGESPETEEHVPYFSLPHPSVFETSLVPSDSLAPVPFPQTLAGKVPLSETADELLLCPSSLGPPSFTCQIAREESLTNYCPPKGSQVLLLTSIFRLIPLPFFFFFIVLHFARFLPRGNFYSSILKPWQLRIYPGNDTVQLE